MTHVSIEPETLPGLHVTYPDQAYTSAALGTYLVALTEVWRGCLAVAEYVAPPTSLEAELMRAGDLLRDQGSALLAELERVAARRSSVAVWQLGTDVPTTLVSVAGTEMREVAEVLSTAETTLRRLTGQLRQTAEPLRIVPAGAHTRPRRLDNTPLRRTADGLAVELQRVAESALRRADELRTVSRGLVDEAAELPRPAAGTGSTGQDGPVPRAGDALREAEERLRAAATRFAASGAVAGEDAERAAAEVLHDAEAAVARAKAHHQLEEERLAGEARRARTVLKRGEAALRDAERWLWEMRLVLRAVASDLPSAVIGGDPGLDHAPRADLIVQRLRIQSPMDLVLSPVSATGVGLGAGAWALHLFAKVIQQPKDVGAWLPNVYTAWHQAKAETARAQLDRVNAEQQLQARLDGLRGASRQLDLVPDVVDVIGAGDPPVDLTPGP